MQRLFPVLFAVLALFARPAMAQLSALQTPTGPILAGPTLVVDAGTGEVLLQRNAGAPWYPASLVKIMTLYVVFEEMKARRLGPADQVPFSQQAVAMPPSKLGIGLGQSITVEQAIQALILRSANDVAVAVAERISGSEAAFAQRLTATAHRLGMTASVFRNASGWPAPDQVTTARDLAMLAIATMRDFPQYYGYYATRESLIGRQRVEATVKFLDMYPGADGLKTGYICASAFNLVASATRDNRRLVGVGLGFRRADLRDEAMVRLMDEAFAKKSGGAGQRVWQLGTDGGTPTVVNGPADCGILTYPYPGVAVWLGTFGDERTALTTIAAANASLMQIDNGPPGREWNLWLARGQNGRPTRNGALLADLLPERAQMLCDLYRKTNRFCVVKQPSEIVPPFTPFMTAIGSGK